jgi:hypothetical protein
MMTSQFDVIEGPGKIPGGFGPGESDGLLQMAELDSWVKHILLPQKGELCSPSQCETRKR